MYANDDVVGVELGGAATWHIAAHHAGLWAAAAPGAGFAETAEYQKLNLNDVPWYEQKLWHWYNATDYAANLFNCPTVVNNVESIASVPSIVTNGADWFKSMGTERSTGYGFFSLSGHVTRPGQYEAPLGITLRELIDLAGGMREGHELKFWTPGGSSTPLLTPEHLDVPLDFESVGAAGSMLGTRALQLFDETTCVVRAVLRWTEFYKHESCGKCTPCREGTWWLVQVLARLEKGQGSEADLDQLLDQCDNILGRSFCALGDGATSPISSSIQHFRDEYLAHLTHGGCPFDPAASTAFAPVGASA